MNAVILSCLGILLLILSLGPCHADLQGPTDKLLHSKDQVRSLSSVPGGKFIFACEYNNMRLECEDEQVIDVKKAYFGLNLVKKCGVQQHYEACLKDVKRQVETMCENQRACEFYVYTRPFGDPCHGRTKYLDVDYVCKERVKTEYYNAYACEENKIIMECTADLKIDVHSANYGRPSRSKCDPNLLGRGSDVRPCTGDVKNRVAQLCDGQNKCQFKVTNDQLRSDPCHWRFKVLDVNFRCTV